MRPRLILTPAPQDAEACCRRRLPRVPISPRLTTTTQQPASSAPPSAICGCRPFRRWLQRAPLRCARIRFNRPGMALLAQTSTFRSSTGFSINARAQEAKLRANAASEQVRNLRDEIARDLRTAVLNAQNAFQRIGVTQEMLNESNMALDLSQARYKIGLSGIVELTQAQLAQTQAQIAYTNARYAYQTALAVVRFQTGQ